MKASKPPKPKQISFSLIPPMDNGHEPEAYKLLREARDRWHPDLEGAKIALAWRERIKTDKDGHLLLGKCMKASDLQRELVNWDFVILLNREAFQDPAFDLRKRLALIDHELCHATRALDRFYAPANDEKGRAVWRCRKHDIEEFRCIVKRHGCYKQDLVKFAEVLLKHGGNLVFPGIGEQVPAVPSKENLASKVFEEVTEQINAGALDTPRVKVTARYRITANATMSDTGDAGTVLSSQVSADSHVGSDQASNGEAAPASATDGDPTGKTQPVSAESFMRETSTEERVRTRAAARRKKQLGQDTALPDKRTQFPHGVNEVQS